jgi:hypothetical protein
MARFTRSKLTIAIGALNLDLLALGLDRALYVQGRNGHTALDLTKTNGDTINYLAVGTPRECWARAVAYLDEQKLLAHMRAEDMRERSTVNLPTALATTITQLADWTERAREHEANGEIGSALYAWTRAQGFASEAARNVPDDIDAAQFDWLIDAAGYAHDRAHAFVRDCNACAE